MANAHPEKTIQQHSNAEQSGADAVQAFKVCVVIPVCNHGQPLIKVVEQLRQRGLSCVLVDDASNAQTIEIMDELAQQEQIFLVRHSVNKGKGGAVMSGLRYAQSLGFTHALQVDADGQHDLQQVEFFIRAASEQPQMMICSYPQYDASVPKGRYYARYLTHILVWLQTLSFAIRDSMCGFRVYPLTPVVQLINEVKLGERMDFDIEILVRLFWREVDMQWYPIDVIYPEDGLSNFRPWQDNWLISKMHTKLIFGMLWRAPRIVWRRLVR